MPFRDWQLRLQDIIESIDEILEWTANMTFEDFSSNRLTLKAVLALRYLLWFDRGA